MIIKDEPGNFPPYGSVMAKLWPRKDLPEFVHLPEIMSNLGYDLPGERAGFLGPAFNPLVAGDPIDPNYQIPALTFPTSVDSLRLRRRRTLLGLMDRRAEAVHKNSRHTGMETHYQKAWSLLASPKTRDAFDLSKEPQKLRERYGLPDRVDRSVESRKFGGLPHLGQCLLLSRRLIEADVRLVTVCTGRASKTFRFNATFDFTVF